MPDGAVVASSRRQDGRCVFAHSSEVIEVSADENDFRWDNVARVRLMNTLFDALANTPLLDVKTQETQQQGACEKGRDEGEDEAEAGIAGAPRAEQKL